MKKKTKKSILAAAAVLSVPMAFLSAAALSNGIHVMNYRVPTDKIENPFRIVLITDLHGYVFGENQRDALEEIKKQKPDLIVLTGDIYVWYRPYEGSTALLDGMMKLCPCFYVSGNHEFITGDMKGIEEIIRETGVEVLKGSCREITVNGVQINVCGVDDPYVGTDSFSSQLETLAELVKENYTILLSHRAELVETYKKTDFDLVLTGHAHGGQWRIPFVMNGLFAPDQGLFPKYAGGLYQYNDTVQIVGRGLTKYDTLPQAIKTVFSGSSPTRAKFDAFPRIFNPPELVVIDVEPK